MNGMFKRFVGWLRWRWRVRRRWRYYRWRVTRTGKYPWFSATVIVIYLAVALLISAVFVARAWPGNAFARPLYVRHQYRVALLQVTAESLKRIDRATSVLNRLPDVKKDHVSQAEIDRFLGDVALARAVEECSSRFEKKKEQHQCAPPERDCSRPQPQCSPSKLHCSPQPKCSLAKPPCPLANPNCPPPPPVPPPPVIAPSQVPTGDPRTWNATKIDQVSRLLEGAHVRLQSRERDSEPDSSRPWIWRMVWGFVWGPNPPDFALTNSEEMRFEEILATTEVSDGLPTPVGVNTPDKPEDAQLAARLLNTLSGLRQLNFVFLLAALGSAAAATQGLASMARYLGERKFNPSWLVFYLTRPWVGAVLGPVFYLILRGGLMTQETTWKEINHVGYAAVAVLVGFCAAEAMENLHKIAGSLFDPKSDKDTLQAPAPRIDSVEFEGGLLRVVGAHFERQAEVLLDGRATTAIVIWRGRAVLNVRFETPPAPGVVVVQVRNPGNVLSNEKVVTLPLPPNDPPPSGTGCGLDEISLGRPGNVLPKETVVPSPPPQDTAAPRPSDWVPRPEDLE